MKYLHDLANYSEATKIKPDFAEAYYDRGNARQTKGDLDGAIADFTKAIEFKPDFAEAYAGRGLVEQAKKDLDDALAKQLK